MTRPSLFLAFWLGMAAVWVVAANGGEKQDPIPPPPVGYEKYL